jgi:GTP-sensing pleiotropic transcriptional regulator CodY
VENAGVKSSVYDIVKAYVVSKIGKIKSADVISDCTSGGRSQILESLKRLVEEGILEKRGTGRSTYYVKIDKNIFN